ncbi:DNA-binding protein RFX6-like protein [Leptotrombidium deliense]|uniref:DNA-binding protein RFX6-like protein n=1 Tax=Leptotrombidium deliense TaxID=299467 RepID=A0A443SVK4_9ACAR|nr:DNA-binding protein RFX6-like protein [Leptotrombidium deliense]
MHRIETNYEFSEGVCLPRCLLYEHYLDFCQTKGHTPIGAAAFGKLVRKKFKAISTRRLGTRGKSKYHYYGLGIQKTSKYYIDSYCTRNIARQVKLNKQIDFTLISKSIHFLTNFRFKGIASKMKRNVRIKKSRCLTSTEISLRNAKQFMIKFPKATEIVVPFNMSHKKLDTFILMYKTHCTQLLDTILCSNFDDFSSFLNNFWSGIPSHLKCLFNFEFTAKLIECCDFIFYEVCLYFLFTFHLLAILSQTACICLFFRKPLCFPCNRCVCCVIVNESFLNALLRCKCHKSSLSALFSRKSIAKMRRNYNCDQHSI